MRLLIIVIALIALPVAIPYIQAVTLGSHSVGVTLGGTCLTMLANNISTSCPTYGDLKQLDNSNQEISGILTDEGREKAKIKNSWRLYDFETDFIVFIDPPTGTQERIKSIVLQPNFDTYFQPDSFQTVMINETVTSQNVFKCKTEAPTKTGKICVEYETTEIILSKPHRIVYHDRYIDERCREAIINADKWELLVADTINLMRNNCDPKHTSYETIQYIPIELTDHDISTSQKYKHDTWVEYVKEFCIFKFRECM